MCRGVRYHSNSLNSGKEHAQKARAESLGPVPLGCLSREPSSERSDRPQQIGALAPEDTARRDEQLSSQPGTLARTGTPRRPGRHPSDPVSVLSSPHTPKPQRVSHSGPTARAPLPLMSPLPGPVAFHPRSQPHAGGRGGPHSVLHTWLHGALKCSQGVPPGRAGPRGRKPQHGVYKPGGPGLVGSDGAAAAPAADAAAEPAPRPGAPPACRGARGLRHGQGRRSLARGLRPGHVTRTLFLGDSLSSPAVTAAREDEGSPGWGGGPREVAVSPA